MVKCLRREEFLEKKRKANKKKKRTPKKPIKITFVVPPCKDCKLLPKCEKGQRIVQRMLGILYAFKLEEYEEISNYDVNLSKKLRENGIPELWMHDFEDDDLPIWPHKMFYFVEYEDGTKRIYTMIQDDDDEDFDQPVCTKNINTVDPMYV